MSRLKILFRQVLYSMRGNRVFSVAHIAGTAISISIVVVIVTFVSMKISDIYPEYGRNRTLKLDNINERAYGSSNVAGPNRKFAELFVEDVPHVEDMSIVRVNPDNAFSLYSGSRKATLVEMYVDRHFWNIFGFEFLYGGLIPEDGYDAVNPQAVISKSAGMALFGTADCIGKSIFRDSMEVRICGVVKDVSPLAEYTFSHIWMPEDAYISDPQWDNTITGLLTFGSRIFLRIDRVSSAGKVYDELERRIDAFNAANQDNVIYRNFMLTNPKSIFFYSGQRTVGISVIMILVFIVTVIVPSLNTLGLVSYRMSRRKEEFGIRRAYGAPGPSIVRQILEENLVLTAFGALVGFLLALGILNIFDSILYRLQLSNFDYDGDFWGLPSEIVRTHTFELSSSFSLIHFLVITVSILVINIVSSLLPALKIVRENIVSELNSKK